jgi:CHAT domain
MPFDLTIWRADVGALAADFARDPRGALARAGVNSIYGFLLGSTILPVAAAYTHDPASAISALISVAGGLGASLIANLAQRKYDAANALAAAAAEAQGAELAPVYEKIAQAVRVIPLAEAALAQAGQADLLEELRDELRRLGKDGQLAGATISQVQSGGVNFGVGNTIGSVGDIVAGDKIMGDKVMGDKVAGNKYVTEGPRVYGPIHSGRDVNIATEQTIQNRDSLSQGPAEPEQGAEKKLAPDTGPATTSRPVPPSTPVTLDFHIYGSSAQITWHSPLIGRRVTPFTPPYAAEELPLVIHALDTLQHPNYPTPANGNEERHFTFSAAEQQTLDRLGLWQRTRLAPTAHRSVGQALYAALGADGQDALAAHRNFSIAERRTTSYVLRFPPDGIDLAVLPWELLWDRQKNQAVLIRGNTIDSCERYVDIDMAIPPPLAAGRRPHLLALAPHYQIPDAIRQDERAARLASWDKLKAAGQLSYDEISPLTMRALNDELRKTPTRPDVVHYFGHGIYRDGTGYLVFDDGRGGRDLVSVERLAAVLGDVRLVVILACQSAMVDDAGGLLTGVAPALSIVTGAVVAMQLTVRTEAATRFAEVFYEELLGKGCSLQEAVARGRQVLFTEAHDGASWYVPTLYIRSREQEPVYLVR